MPKTKPQINILTTILRKALILILVSTFLFSGFFKVTQVTAENSGETVQRKEPDDLTGQKWLEDSFDYHNVADVFDDDKYHLQLDYALQDIHSLEFDSNDNNYVHIPADESHDVQNELTVSAWVKWNSPASRADIVTKDFQTRVFSLYQLSSSELRFWIMSGSSWIGSGYDVNFTPEVGRWYHIIGTRDGTYQKLFIDSVKQYEADHGHGAINTGSDIAIGGRGYDTIDGNISDVRIYNRALSEEELLSLYQREEVSDTGLVGHWEFKEQEGTTASDSSGEGNDGTLVPEGSEPVWTHQEAVYHEEGFRQSEPLSLDSIKNVASSNIKWTKDTPTDTDVKIFTSISESDEYQFGEIDVLVVGGGGAGGSAHDGSTATGAGGGGAGDFVLRENFKLITTNYNVIVGDGGLITTTRGEDGESSFFGSIEAIGGGGGGQRRSADGKPGASGGGAGYQGSGGGAIGEEGYKGGDNIGSTWGGAGGGGAGQPGEDADGLSSSDAKGFDGGDGWSSNITGEIVWYAGGGGGGAGSSNVGAGGAGGAGGGGGGADDNTMSGFDGAPNTGGGGGGSSGDNHPGGDGGSGIVIVRYHKDTISATGGTVTEDGDYRIHTFTEDGIFEIEGEEFEATNDSAIPGIEEGEDLTGKYLWIRQELSTEDVAVTPRLIDLEVLIEEEPEITEPTIETNQATNIEVTSVTLHGELIDLGGADNVEIWFEWSTEKTNGELVDPSDSKNVLDPLEEPGTFNYTISGLDPGTTYYFRAVAENSAGIAIGTIESFITLPAAPTNVSATKGTHTDKVTITWTKSTGATEYQVYRNDTPLGWLGDVDEYEDTGADPPTISAGTADASDGTSVDYVTLTLSGHSANNGTSHSYKVRAKNATGESTDSSTSTGYRGTAALTYQWQRSAGDSDADYSNITNATTVPYDDYDGVTHPGGRYYRCVVTMDGAESQTSAADRGYKTGIPSVSTQDATGITDTSATLQGNLTNTGGADSVDVWFEWSEDETLIGPNTNTPEALTETGAFNHTISGLDPETTYYFRAVAKNDAGTVEGDILSFTTETEEEEPEPVNGVFRVTLTEHFTAWRGETAVGLPVTSGLVLHLDATQGITKDGDNKVSAWADQSGEGNNATQATSDNQPLWVDDVLAGKPVVYFDAIDDYITIAGGIPFSAGTSFTMVVVFRPLSWVGANPGIWRDGETSGGGQFKAFQSDTGRPWFRWDNRTILAPTSGYSVPLAEDILTAWLVKDAESAEFYVNGDIEHQANHTRSAPAFSIYNIGYQFRTSERIEAYYAEILIYDTALSTADREDVEQYLGEKWLGW